MISVTDINSAASSLRRLVFPDLCLGCETHVAKRGVFCPRCWNEINFIEHPLCDVTGVPFSYDVGATMVSPKAIANPPSYDRARSVATHDGIAKALVSRLKYGDRTDLAPWMAAYMQKAGSDLLIDADVIIPVPLHRTRYWSRRFNQAAELARALSKRTSIQFAPEALLRTRPTRQQVGLGAKDRSTNVRSAFRVPDYANITVAGRRIVLIDDVITTEATINAAAKALRRAKAAQINVIAFSRALDHD